MTKMDFLGAVAVVFSALIISLLVALGAIALMALSEDRLAPPASRLTPSSEEPGAPAVVILSVGATGGRPEEKP